MKKKILLSIIILANIPLWILVGHHVPGLIKKTQDSIQEEMERMEKISDRKKLMEERYEIYIQAIEPFRKCISDSSCVRTSDGPCGCGGGGKAIAVNEKYLDEAKAIQNNIYTDTGCAAVMSQDISCISPPVCIDFKCTINTNNDDFCEKSPEPNRCYYEFALQNQDVNLCEKLQTEKPNFSRSGCIMNLATSTSDISLCAKLKGEDQLECRDNFYVRSARDKSDYRLCFKIESSNGQEDCLFTTIIREDNTENCQYLESESKRVSCIGNILSDRAREMEDPEICLSIPTEKGPNPSQEQCLNKVAPLAGKPEYCVKDEGKPIQHYESCVERATEKMEYLKRKAGG